MYKKLRPCALQPDDRPQRKQFSVDMLAWLHNDDFSDEATFHIPRMIYKHIIRIWGSGNPHETRELEGNSPKISVECVASHLIDQVIDPFCSAEKKDSFQYLDWSLTRICYSIVEPFAVNNYFPTKLCICPLGCFEYSKVSYQNSPKPMDQEGQSSSQLTQVIEYNHLAHLLMGQQDLPSTDLKEKIRQATSKAHRSEIEHHVDAYNWLGPLHGSFSVVSDKALFLCFCLNYSSKDNSWTPWIYFIHLLHFTSSFPFLLKSSH